MKIIKLISILCIFSLFCLVISGCDSSNTTSIDEIDTSESENTESTVVFDTTCSHEYEEKIIKEPTCIGKGIKEFRCSKCGESYEEDINSTGKHNYKSEIIKKPNCTQSGIKRFTCVVCGKSYEEIIPALGHEWLSATCTNPKKCKNCGISEGKALGHKDNGNGKCSRCGTTLEIDMKTKIGQPSKCFFGVNSANGLNMVMLAKNNSGKTINYYTFILYFKNPVGDPAYDEITGKNYKEIRVVGPIAPGEDIPLGGIVGYSETCNEIIIGKAKLEYSDKTTDSGWYGYIAKNYLH